MKFLAAETRGVREQMIIPLSDEKSDLVVENGIYSFYLPYSFTISEFYMSVNESSTGANIIVDMKDSNGTSIFTTLPSIDATENTSNIAATLPVFATGKNLLQANRKYSFDLTQVGSGDTGQGLKVMLIGHNSI